MNSNQPVIVSNDDELYRRVFKNHVRKDRSISPAAFMRKGEPEQRPSVNLARFSTRDATLNQAPQAMVAQLTVIGILAHSVRSAGLDAEHKERPDNYSHCEITGTNTDVTCSAMADEAYPV